MPLSFVLILCFFSPLLSSRSDQSSSPSGATARFLAPDSATLQSYRARRHLEASNARLGTSGWLDVETTFDASGFSYRVLDDGGAPNVIRKVLIPALEGERRALADAEAGALTHANYAFTDEGLVNGWERIRLVPKRRDGMLVDGWLFVSPESADFVELHGRLVQSPSFWVTRVGIVRRYARVAGVRVPVATESTASVRFIGSSTFSMRYHYEIVNGIDVSIDTPDAHPDRRDASIASNASK